ncbi:NCAPD3 family protein [Megaselia abdita]
MSDAISNDFQRLNEAIPFSLNWEEIDDIYESSDPPETILSKLIEIPVIRYALQEENTIRSILMELCTNIIRVRDPSTYDVAETMVSSEINWESLVRLINKDKFLSLVHGLAGLALLNPLAIQYRKLSLAACSTYLLSLTIGGSTGYEVFQEKIVQQVLSVFDLVAQVQKKVPFKNQSHLCELWILFTNFVDHLKLAFRSCSLSSSLDLKDLILQKIFDFHDYNFQNGYSNKYALTVHRSLFALLDIFMNPRHGDQETTAKDFVKWTWDFHRYPPEPKKVGFHIPHSDEVVEHISHWFKKSITKYTNVMVNVLHFYIKCVVEIPDKDWHPEHIKQALEYAAKYDVEIYKKANQSIIPYLEDEINSGNGENASRAIELLGYISHQKLQVECSLISATEDIPREVEILRILIDTLLDPNVTIQTKALQSLQAIGSSSNTSGKILTELIVNCKYEDEDITLPFDYPAKIEVIEENVHSYSFTGSEILVDLIQELPQRIYYLLHSKQAHTKRVALCFIEFMVRLNKNIILRSDFCKEMSRLKSDSSVIVTRQAMQSIDSILSTFPNCYPVVWTWCELFTSLLNNPDERNDALGREYFKNKVLDNIRSFDGNKSPEHLLCWEILKTLINITSRLYVQSNISRLMVPNMVSYELITMVSSHVDQKNKYLALVVLNLICPFCSGNLDALVNLAFTNHLFIKKDEFKDDPDGVYTAQARFSDERVILLALDLFTNCIDKFSKLSISKLFDEVIKLLEAGRIFHSTIDRALNLLQHIHKTLDSTKRDPRENEKWADDLYKNLEDKLISWSMEFPENYHQYIPCLMTYVLLNCERIDSVHPELERLVQKQLLMCSSCDESKITHREQFIYSSFIIIAGYLSFRSTHVAVKNCSLFVAILKNCELHSIVKNLTIVYTDISKKHGRIFELFLCEVTEKFVSPDVRNRTAAFECLERLIREEHLLLKKNLLYRIVFVMLDEDAELSNRVIRFFFEFASKKNPKFFQVCLRDFPLDLTGYNDVLGL